MSSVSTLVCKEELNLLLVSLVKVRWVWANRHWFPFYQYLDLIQSELAFKNQEMFKGYVDEKYPFYHNNVGKESINGI